VVLGHALYTSMLAELGRGFELSGLTEDGLDVLLSELSFRHGSPVLETGFWLDDFN